MSAIIIDFWLNGWGAPAPPPSPVLGAGGPIFWSKRKELASTLHGKVKQRAEIKASIHGKTLHKRTIQLHGVEIIISLRGICLHKVSHEVLLKGENWTAIIWMILED